MLTAPTNSKAVVVKHVDAKVAARNSALNAIGLLLLLGFMTVVDNMFVEHRWSESGCVCARSPASGSCTMHSKCISQHALAHKALL